MEAAYAAYAVHALPSVRLELHSSNHQFRTKELVNAVRGER